VLNGRMIATGTPNERQKLSARKSAEILLAE
jgi:hypothetical protein